MKWAFLAGSALSLGCASPTLESRREAAAPAVAALQGGRFDEADKLASERSASDSGDPYSHMVHAITRFKKTNHQLVLDGTAMVLGGLETGTLNQKYLRTTFGDAESELAAVESDLAVAAREPAFSMELCPACWEIDWNGNGHIDNRDKLLLQLEQDADGNPIPDDDPRRKPTFRFDHGDVAWARAFVSFERAGLDLLLAYDWTEAARVVEGHADEHGSKIVIRLVDPDRVEQARTRILEGLAQSDQSRRDYLVETDDDREWMPSPRQKNHPIPLPVDQALYDTWEGVVGDVRRLVEGEEGLSVSEALALADERPRFPPSGYLDIGRMLSHPKDIVIDVDAIERLDRKRDVDGEVSAFFGEYYVTSMKPSPLPRRLFRMKDEIDKQEGEFDRKLRYLFWIN
jgi:hypothetical protein